LSYVGVNDGETAGQTVLYDLGNFLAIATTGKRVSFSGSVIFRVADGKIVERWAQLDNLSLLQQLDAIPRARTVGGSQPHLIISSRTPLRTSENASSATLGE
jgi:SnoaL-like polyketide cyclase